jgi:hypothetical protein
MLNILRRRKPGKKSSCRGAEMLEVTLIAAPLFGLTFLLLDLSMVLFLRVTFQNAVRDGVRYAITGQNTPGPCQDDSVRAVVKKSSLGFLNNSPASGTIHVRFIDPVSGAVTNNAYGNIVEVSVEAYSYGPLAPFNRLNMPIKLWARAYDMMEFVPGTLPCITTHE